MEDRERAATKSLGTQSAVNAAVWSICDIMRRSNCAGAMQYVPELTWILFLRIFDERETHEAERAAAVGADFRPSLAAPYRWQDWAAPDAPKRKELMEGAMGAFFSFVNGDLIPHLKTLGKQTNATARQKVIAEIMSGVDRTRIDTERNFCDVLDKVHEVTAASVDDTHVFTLSQVYEGLLLKMGEKGNDGGQFFTPREIVRTVVEVIAPTVGETVYDPCCGTGGFLAQAYEHMIRKLGDEHTGDALDTLKERTFYGREKENLVYPVGLANLMLHGIDQPHIWHGNVLTQQEVYGGLYEHAPRQFNVILANPPFGGKEGLQAQARFAYKTKATEVLFLQDILESLAPGGRCGLVMPEGALFQTSQDAFVKTKRRLLDTCDLWCIVSLPGGVFAAAGAGVKTNLLFFTKGKATERIWYFDLSDVKVGKKTPFTRDRLKDFFALLPTRGDSDRSWTIDFAARRKKAKADADAIRAQTAPPRAALATLKEQESALTKAKAEKAEIEAIRARMKDREREIRALETKAQQIEDAAFDLKAVNPTAKAAGDLRTPTEMLDFIDEKGREIADALKRLRLLETAAD